MKKIIVFAAALLFCLCLFTACFSAKNNNDEAFLNTYIKAEPMTLDPSLVNDVYGYQILINILEPLIRINDPDAKNSVLTPAGAESWEISADELEYTFHLRENYWNDGKPVTSEDYAFGIRRNTMPDTRCLSASFLFPLKNGEAVKRGKKNIEELGILTPDSKTLILKLEKPLSYFLELCASAAYFPQREDIFTKNKDAYTSIKKMPQCGPFVIAYRKINNEINFSKNKKHWNAKNIMPDTVSCKVIHERRLVPAYLFHGDLDYTYIFDSEWNKKFTENLNFDHFSTYDKKSFFVIANCSEGRLSSNKKIRQAINRAIDRKKLVKEIHGESAKPLYSLVPPPISCRCCGEEFYNENFLPAKFTKEEKLNAKKLLLEGLQELGIKTDPKDITVEYMISKTGKQDRNETEYISKMISENLGITVKIGIYDWNEAFFSKLVKKDYDFAMLHWDAALNDPSDFFELAWSDSKILDFGWNNKEYDECILKAKNERDPHKRFDIFRRADEILCREESVFFPIMYRVSHIFKRKFVKSVPINPFNTMGWQVIDTSDRS